MKYFRKICVIMFVISAFCFQGTTNICLAAPPGPSVSFNANPEVINSGGASTLSWTSKKADTVIIDNGIGDVPLNGSISVTPLDSTTYTITASGSSGTASSSVTVTVNTSGPQPPSVSINASTTLLLQGESSTLSWNSSNAESVTIDNGIDGVSASGSLVVTPSQTTTYTISATGQGGSDFDTVTLAVGNQPFITPTEIDLSTNFALRNTNQIVRSSSGQLYLFGRQYSSTNSYIALNTSSDTENWSALQPEYDFHGDGQINVSIDSNDIIHVISYNDASQLFYRTFNTIDSIQADHTWNNDELINPGDFSGFDCSVAQSENDYPFIIPCSIAVDGNDVPHVVYLLSGKKRGVTVYSYHYANRIGGIWNTTTLRSEHRYFREAKIAVGLDNIPYILFGPNVMYKGNGNNPTSFEGKTFNKVIGGFVCHGNGDIRIPVVHNGCYANYVHSFSEPWGTGWELVTTKWVYNGSIDMFLLNDVPYSIWFFSNELWLQEQFNPPELLIESQYNLLQYH